MKSLILGVLLSLVPAASFAGKSVPLSYHWPTNVYIPVTEIKEKIGPDGHKKIIQMKFAVVVSDGAPGNQRIRIRDISTGSEADKPSSEDLRELQLLSVIYPAFEVDKDGEVVTQPDDSLFINMIKGVRPEESANLKIYSEGIKNDVLKHWSIWVHHWTGIEIAPGQTIKGQVENDFAGQKIPASLSYEHLGFQGANLHIRSISLSAGIPVCKAAINIIRQLGASLKDKPVCVNAEKKAVLSVVTNPETMIPVSASQEQRTYLELSIGKTTLYERVSYTFGKPRVVSEAAIKALDTPKKKITEKEFAAFAKKVYGEK